MKGAVENGFVVERGDGIRLADLIARGPDGSRYENRTYGPTIAFCPFCGAALEQRGIAD
jgi:hypothetical protein